jgi:hypothetical protein
MEVRGQHDSSGCIGPEVCRAVDGLAAELSEDQSLEKAGRRDWIS